MTKQKLEKKFSDTLRPDNRFWGMKLHNNPLAHQTTPADFLMNYDTCEYYKDNTNCAIGVDILHSALVECKQVTCETKNRALNFKRLKQTNDLLAFNKFSDNHHSYYLIAFKEKFWRNSDIYLIPIIAMKGFMDNWHKVSANRIDFKEHFRSYKYETFALVLDSIFEAKPIKYYA